jgi:hypothetical protein
LIGKIILEIGKISPIFRLGMGPVTGPKNRPGKPLGDNSERVKIH